ncbi:YcaO-like family protein [Streptomyces sp. YS-3]|uniref:YcaO-like family protein n=1 Tax=Streptomyces sp. YS-3 TaxID=3381352 RepID=UPI00386232B7
MHKVYFDGTHRTRHPAQTWQALRPLLPTYGITRVADVTGLDDLGIPVTMTVRPLARTLAVAQGKGTSLAAARVSGAMEAIEVWHAEHAVPAASEIRIPAREMGLPYPVTALELHPGHLVTDRTRLDWITAECAVDGTPVPVPATCVTLGRETHREWRLHLPSASTNGLASGNTRAEAMAHGLCEIIERDVLSDLPSDAERLDAESIDDPHCAKLIDRLSAAGVWTELWHLPNRFQVPVAACYLWREDQPALLVSGSGAHLDPRIALSRAITEAAQSRLTHITGSREDTPPTVYRTGPYKGPAPISGKTVAWPAVTQRYEAAFDEDDVEAAHLATAVTTVTGIPPLAVDLTHGPYAREEFTVLKILAPHLRYDSRHAIARPGGPGVAA